MSLHTFTIVIVSALLMVSAGCQRFNNGAAQEPLKTTGDADELSPKAKQDAPAVPLLLNVQNLPFEAEAPMVADAIGLLHRNDVDGAQTLLAPLVTPHAALLRARVARQQKDLDAAARELEKASADATLHALVSLERALVQMAAGNGANALPLLQTSLANSSLAHAAVMPLLDIWPSVDAAAMLARIDDLEQALPKPEHDADARSRFFDAWARAHEALGEAEKATEIRRRRYIQEPVSLLTPETPPKGAILSSSDQLARAQRLLDAHRSERVMALLDALPDAELTAPQQCEKSFAQGLASRKLRHYSTAETHLSKAMEICDDEDLVRRAAYLHAKVVSIRSGLRAVPFVEQFAEKFAGHSMVDDVLFWAGDLYQRRGQFENAARYYQKIQSLEPKDDYCAEARWRLAWMEYRRERFDAAQKGLLRMLADDGCVNDAFDRARAHYWLGKVALITDDHAAAWTFFAQTLEQAPLSFYSQQAMARMQELDAERAAKSHGALRPPAPTQGGLQLCADTLASQPVFHEGLNYLLRGLGEDAVRAFEVVALAETEVLAGTHAAALGVAAQPVQRAKISLESCGPAQANLLLTLLLDKAGAKREAHWRLRTTFADILQAYPTAETLPIWQAAFPLAFRDLIGPAEDAAGLPPFFLQALAREESAFDPRAVSWAGAYGLTQLLLSTAQAAGRLLHPKISVQAAEELLEPALSARLGAAFLGSLTRRFAGNLGLVLAAYNAGDNVALTWWKRHHEDSFDVFAEEMTIRETRGYVARVLRTFGIYQWLYGEGLPVLPIEAAMPALPAAK